MLENELTKTGWLYWYIKVNRFSILVCKMTVFLFGFGTERTLY